MAQVIEIEGVEFTAEEVGVAIQLAAAITDKGFEFMSDRMPRPERLKARAVHRKVCLAVANMEARRG